MDSSVYTELARRRLLEEMYDKMTDEEKRLFIVLTMQNRNADEIRQEIRNLRFLTEKNKHSFAQDLTANIAGNAIFDGAVYLFAQLFKRIRP